MINEFNKASCQTFRDDVLAALKGLEEKHGVKISYKGGSFLESNFTLKIEAAIVNGTTGEAETKERTDFGRYCHRYGLQPADLDASFTHQGVKHQIIGARPRSRKYPILARRSSDGQRICFPAHYVKTRLVEG